MVNFKKILLSIPIFFLSYVFCALTESLADPMISILSNATFSGATTLAGIMWIGFIAVWFIAMPILPIGLMIQGILEDQQEKHPLDYLLAFLYAFIAIAVTYFTWYWTTPMAGVFTEPLLIVGFWITLFGLYIMHTIVIPIYLAVQSNTQ